MNRNPGSLSRLVDRCPPFLVVALARKPDRSRKGMSLDEISQSTGFPRRTLVRILSRTSWGSTKMSTISIIFEACQINVMQMGRERKYLRRTSMASTPLRHLTHQKRSILLRQMSDFTGG